MKLSYFCFTALLLLSFSLLAEDTKSINSQFKDSYHQYQAAVKANDRKAQMKYAKQSYKFGKQVYGESSINTANLAFNLASIYNENQKYTAAHALLLPLLKVYKKEYGADSIKHIDLYFGLGKSESRAEKRINYYLKALNIADEQQDKNPILNAKIQLEAGAELLALGSIRSKIILKARDYFTEHLKPNDKRVVRANFYAGKYYSARKKLKKSIAAFEANLPVFETLEGPTHPLELSTHAFLIDVLERAGKSEEATKHCIAIGSMTPWSDSQEQTPLYRSIPKYPQSKAMFKREGFVKMEFTISDSGFVKNAKVLESKGGKSFETAAFAALKQWRYAPKFENGNAVEATSTIQLNFNMAKE